MELLNEPFSNAQLNELSTLTLAHVGDGVFELLARTYVARTHGGRVRQMHRFTVAIVSAVAQAEAARRLLPIFSLAENDVFMRGRNSKPKSIPKNASPEDYAFATGLEAVFGMLYLTGQSERILTLWGKILSKEC